MTAKQIDRDIYNLCIRSINTAGLQSFMAWLHSVEEGLVSKPDHPSYMHKVSRERWLRIASDALYDYMKTFLALVEADESDQQVVVE